MSNRKKDEIFKIQFDGRSFLNTLIIYAKNMEKNQNITITSHEN